jgi:hypothetical protein
MVRLQISAAAFAAIVATLPGNVNVENKRAPNGDVYVWLDPAVIAKLKAMRAAGEDYSTVILSLAEAHAGRLGSRGARRRPDSISYALQ